MTSLSVLVLTLPAMLAAALTVMAPPTVTPVAAVDLQRYAGRWFEIARYPNRFQKRCVANTTAEYTLRPDGRLTVTNRCQRADGSVDEAIGIARPRDTGRPDAAMFKVRFAPGWLSLIPKVWGDYWILALPADYRYAVIGEPSRNYLWILSRTPQMSDTDYTVAVDAAVTNGYDPSRLIRTPQTTRN